MKKQLYIATKLLKIMVHTFIIMIATLMLNEPVVNTETVMVRHDELRKYTIEYLTLLNEYDIDYDKRTMVIVRMSNVMGMEIAGAAYGMMKDDEINVVINERTWKYLNDDQKRWLVYHELSHDMFDMRHFSTPVMHPRTPTARKAKKDWEYNKKMLFLSIKRRKH